MAKAKYDVVVVGAGISGLTTAYQLSKKDPNISFILLEAKDRVGGRTLTVPLKAANGVDYWDLGGQWVGRSQPHIMDLLEELGLETYQQYTNGTKCMQLGDFKPRTYKSNIPSLSFISLIDLQNVMWKIERMRKTVSCQDPWSCRDAVYWDSITLDTFCRQNIWTKAAMDAILAATRGSLGMEPSQMSLLFFLLYLDSSDGLNNLVEATEFAAQGYKIKGGAQQISSGLADLIGHENIKLNEPVISVKQDLDLNIITIKTLSGEMYTCTHLVMALPPPTLSSIEFEPTLPAPKLEIMRHMPKGNMTKIIITYKEAFWKKKGYSGEIVSNGGKSMTTDCDTGPVCVVFDATTPDNNPALLAFIAGLPVIQYSCKTAEEREQCVLNQLSTFWGGDAFDYIEYKEQDWNREPYINGAPVCCLATGSMRYFVDGIRKPFHTIHFGGTESATQWCGYMSGAVQAGLRTAIEILQEIRPAAVSAEDLRAAGMTFQRKVNDASTCRKWLQGSIGLGSLIALGFRATKKFAASIFRLK